MEHYWLMYYFWWDFFVNKPTEKFGKQTRQ